MSDIKRQLNHLRSGKTEPSDESSIRSKLNRLYNRRDQDQKHFVEERVVRAHKRLEELVSGEYINTPFGDIFRARTTYEKEHLHGKQSLDDFWEVHIPHLMQLGKLEDIEGIDLERTLFLDTEASGLSGGTGTYAFMIGLGYFHDDHFIVDQLFVDSYVKEEGMLDLLKEYLTASTLLVTFNGKSFDLNLLRTRYLLHGQSDPFTDIPHLDLLHPCRNLWDLDLVNCKLQTLEKEILDFYREDDTPGEEVPGIYFQFIRTGDASDIAGVFTHNVHDIVSLVGVTTMLEQNFHGARDIPMESGLTMFSRGKIHERQGNISEALRCYESALSDELSSQRRNQVLSRIAALYKKRGEWELAVRWWRQQIENMPVFILEPYRELAKYFEHQVKDFEEALRLVDFALDQIASHRTDDIAALTHRRNRLSQKIERLG